MVAFYFFISTLYAYCTLNVWINSMFVNALILKYRLLAFVVFFIILASCTAPPPTHKPSLTLADLSFPLVDDYYGMQTPPNTYKRHILNNHISARVATEIIDPKIDSGKYYRQYLMDPSCKKIDFSTWYADSIARFTPVTLFFDKKGNLTSRVQRCFLCGPKEYRYDSLGFVIWESSGSDAIYYYGSEYHFDANTRTLYRTSCLYLSSYDSMSSSQRNYPFGLTAYRFDSVGKLTTTTEVHLSHWPLKYFYFTDTFFYNKDNQISLITHQLYEATDHEVKKYLDLPASCTTRYFYHDRTLDSMITVITTTQNKKQTKRTYFDSSGLAAYTVEVGARAGIDNTSYPYRIDTKYSYREH